MENQYLNKKSQVQTKKNHSLLKVIFILDVVFLVPVILGLVGFIIFFSIGYSLAGAPAPDFTIDASFLDNIFIVGVIVFVSGFVYVLSLIPAIISTIYYKKNISLVCSRFRLPDYFYGNYPGIFFCI